MRRSPNRITVPSAAELADPQRRNQHVRDIEPEDLLGRHLRWAETAATAWHFRTAAGQEVDLVLEAPGQRIVGIEVKASASITHGDFNGATGQGRPRVSAADRGLEGRTKPQITDLAPR